MGTPIPMLDLMFFLTENRDNPRHVGAVLIFARPRQGGALIVPRIIEAYRNARPVAPFNRIPLFRLTGLPQWRELDQLDMQWHVQHLQLPGPGSDTQLDDLVARLHAPMLERDRPGWRLFVIEGLERNRFALYVKIHHALVDGQTGIALVHRTLSRSQRHKTIRPVTSTGLPGRAAVAPASLVSTLERQAVKTARAAFGIGTGSNRLLGEALSSLGKSAQEESQLFTAPHTPMNEPIRNARSITHVVLPLDPMLAVAKAWDTTLNDVALCVLDASMNRYLRSLERPASRPLVTICPVSLHEGEIKQATTNVSAMWTQLGRPKAPIGQRMREVIAHTREAKARLRSLPKEGAYSYAVLTFALGEAVALIPRGVADNLITANVLISNVRGPNEPLYLGGARLEALCPVSTLLAGMGLNITLMSYAGKVVIAFTANATALPHLGRLAQYTREEFAALQRQAPGSLQSTRSSKLQQVTPASALASSARASGVTRKPAASRRARVKGK
jgi:diacylglycerol O-acyltransferase